jgi:hypothetical protein
MRERSGKIPGIMEQFYDRYPKRKSWYGRDDYFSVSEKFEKELKRAGTKPGSSILEIGFGDGLFLDWARDSGHIVTGVEINRNFVQSAKKRGHEVYRGDPGEIFKNKPRSFDLIVLLDVLEHLTVEKIVALFTTLRTLLKPEGEILARFPNGLSPFGRFFQYGDVTHITTLSGPKVEDIARLTGLKVEAVYNSARSFRGGRRGRIWFFKAVAYLIREVLQRVIGYLYFDENIPLDPDLTVIITHDRKISDRR